VEENGDEKADEKGREQYGEGRGIIIT